MEEPMKVVLDKLEENIKDKLYYRDKCKKASEHLEELSCVITILKRTVKSFNDFLNEKGLREQYQAYFDNEWVKREENK